MFVMTVGAWAERPRPSAYITPPSPRPAAEIATDHVRDAYRARGLAAEDVADLEITDQYTSAHTRVTHVYLRQRVDGLAVFRSALNVNVSDDGRIVNSGGRARRLHARMPQALAGSIWSAEDAVIWSALQLGLDAPEDLRMLEHSGGPAREALFSGGGISRDPIPVRLVYFALDSGALRLAWNLVIHADAMHWWHVHIDAETGDLLWKNNWVSHADYRVFALPLESPLDGGRTLVSDPAETNASPYHWHDTNGAPGAEFTDTRGNNVFAQEDVDANDSGGFRPDGGAGLNFDFLFDPDAHPYTNQSAAIVNLFYWNNVLHDIHYQYGFTEAAGNFQQNNYGKGGLGNDAVRADAQDGADMNNATFATPPDGTPGRMQMFLWDSRHNLAILGPAAIAGDYAAGGADFGPALTATGITGTVVLALDPADGAGPSETDGCSPLTNAGAISGNIALVDRGDCFFIEKVKHAQDAGAIGVIIANNAGDDVFTMGEGTNIVITIPSILIGQSHGDLIKAELSNGVTATLSQLEVRDSSFDNGIIIHEYGHGVSTRLTGGPSNSDCLEGIQSGGMGEGWSDWWTIALTARTNHTRTTNRYVGEYVQGPGGIRAFPYTTDLAANPLTYGAISNMAGVHAVGTVWASALWEVYWDLVEIHGMDPDLYHGAGGNNIALRLIMDGLKLQSCNPTFLDARDAILLADQVLYGGAHQCLLWRAFARRGMGLNADDGGSHTNLSVTEDFDVPTECLQPTATALTGDSTNLVLTWSAQSGLVYQVQSSTNLLLPFWTLVGGPVTAAGVSASADLGAPGEDVLHLRVLFDVPP